MRPLIAHPQVALAEHIAREAHAGQVDKADVPYIEHPIWVATHVAVRTPRTQAAALLHDVIEDTEWTVNDLLALDVHPIVVADVELLTKPQYDRNGEVPDIDAYRAGICTSLSATVVKIADTLHNLDPNRGWGKQMKDRKRHEYHTNLMVYGEHLARALYVATPLDFNPFGGVE